jgi:hypothetical protein
MTKRAPIRHCYLAVDEDQERVADWLNALDEERTVDDRPDRTVHYFRGMAKEPLPPTEQINQEKTPLVFNIKPRLIRGTLWTDAAVEFTPISLKAQFPSLYKIHLGFARRIKSFDLIFGDYPVDVPNTRSSMMPDIANVAEPDEIEITPEMIEAGSREIMDHYTSIADWPHESVLATVSSAVFLAMMRLVPK